MHPLISATYSRESISNTDMLLKFLNPDRVGGTFEGEGSHFELSNNFAFVPDLCFPCVYDFGVSPVAVQFEVAVWFELESDRSSNEGSGGGAS